MLTRLHVDNFKCFRALSLPMAPLTVLTGFNAAGKSTSLQGALILSQALRLGGQSGRLPLNGPLVKLGTPGEILNDSSGQPEIGIGIESEESRLDWRLGTEDRSRGTSLQILSMSARTQDETCTMPVAAGGLVGLTPPGMFSDKGPNSALAIWSVIRSLGDAVFVSAVRTAMGDVFPMPDVPNPIHADVGVQGEYAPWWLERCGDLDVDSSRLNHADPAQTVRRQWNAWANTLFPGAEANARAVDRTTLVQLELRNRITDAWRRPANIGYGLSYAFPIIIAALLARRGQLIIIDSPEAHLHPKAQSGMGFFLAKMAAAGVQLAIETHSDHVLNGIRIAVQSGAISSENVAIHFFSPPPQMDTDPAQVTSPTIDSAGNLSDWPQGFFDQGEKDLARLSGWI